MSTVFVDEGNSAYSHAERVAVVGQSEDRKCRGLLGLHRSEIYGSIRAIRAIRG